MSHEPKAGLLLVNLGTPEGPTTSEVRPYLREFLMDGRVITIPGPLRWMLVNGIIAPFRGPKSAKAYQTVWSDEGSPLLVHGVALADKVRARMGGAPVVLAMRYGSPSIEDGLKALLDAGCERIAVLSLYPQSASATTGSTTEKVMDVLKEMWSIPTVSFVPPFYEHSAFIEAQAARGRPVIDELKPDHVLFSFHGLPEDHVRRSDKSGAHCLASEDCCAQLTATNRFCYRAQCHATARALIKALDLDEAQASVAFQSRLGRAEWIKPYTADTVVELAKAGKKRLAVFCPAFVADCLETLEEIGVEAREEFKHAGGDELIQVPCVNAEDDWADAVVELVNESTSWFAKPQHEENADAASQS